MDPAAFLNDVAAALHRRAHGRWAPGRPGYSLPRCGTGSLVIPAEDEAALARFGISVEGNPGHNNLVWIDAGQPLLELKLRLGGCTGTRIVIGSGATLVGRFAFNGDGSILMLAGVGATSSRSALRLTMGPGGAAYLGKGLTSVSSDWILEGAERSLVVGDDLMASWGVSVRNYDSHALFDLAERRVINAAGDIHIGPHVWIGQDARILRGATVGAGAVIGAGAIVTGDVPACAAVAGSPARVVRTGISWTRNAQPTDAEMARIAALVEGWAEPA